MEKPGYTDATFPCVLHAELLVLCLVSSLSEQVRLGM